MSVAVKNECKLTVDSKKGAVLRLKMIGEDGHTSPERSLMFQHTFTQQQYDILKTVNDILKVFPYR